MQYEKIFNPDNALGALRFSPENPGPRVSLEDMAVPSIIHTGFDDALQSIQDKRDTLNDQTPDAALSFAAAAIIYKKMMVFGTGCMQTQKLNHFRKNIDTIIDHVAQTQKPGVDRITRAVNDSFSYILADRMSLA
jgi:hypothetical protein